MFFSKRAGPSSLALWGSWGWSVARAAGRGVKSHRGAIARIGKALAKAVLALGAALCFGQWFAPWLGSLTISKGADLPVMEFKGPLPTATQWKTAQDLAGQEFDCAAHAAKNPWVGRTIHMDKRCHAAAWWALSSALDSFSQERRAEAREGGVQARRENKRLAEETEEAQERVGQRLALGIARRLGEGAGVEQAAREALKEERHAQTLQEGAALLTLAQGGPAKTAPPSEEELHEARSREGIQALTVALAALDPSHEVEIPASAVREAMLPTALWFRDGAAARSAAESEAMASGMRRRGVALLLALGAASVLGFLLLGPIKAAARLGAGATRELRAQALPRWEAKQMGKAARTVKKQPQKNRL
jgi:hypothetical protein